MLTQRKRCYSDQESQVTYFSSPELSETCSIVNQDSIFTCEMTCRDRTGEFMSTVKNMRGRLLSDNGFLGPKNTKRVKDSQEWQIFMLTARQIGKDISNTFAKLEKLTILAKKRSLFDDKPVEIQELTYIIKHDISDLNQKIAELKEKTRVRNHHGKHMLSHSNSIVVLLQSKLASMSCDFKQVLEQRTENLKHQKNRREQFSKGSVSSSLPVSAVTGHNGSVLLSDDQDHYSKEVSINMDGMRENEQQQLLLLDEQDSYVQNRADTMQNIEATIVELGTIFQQLACMVKEQEEMVQRIDANVEDTQLNVEAAHSEILKYFQHVTSNRWLMLKVFGVLIIFFVIFVVFVA